jgi:hypothetical protein
MPHRCTKCGREYQDGDMQILQGCECGNNKFLYVPKEKRDIREQLEMLEIKSSDAGIESVKIIAPGQYEINLDKIFTRDEIIIALQQDGRYMLHLPSLLKRRKKK